MTRRFLTLGLAAAVLALGGMNARAGSVTLPTTLDQLTASGATTTPSPGGPTFSDFTYSTSPVGSPPAAGDVSVHALSSPSEAGLQFLGSFSASPGSTVDYAITYRVDAAPGSVINDAFLGTTGTVVGGTGAYAVTETIRTTSFTALASLEGTNLSPNPPGVTFAGQSSILVEKDMVLFGGSNGASVSIIDQAFSTGAIPEPTSMALLGIGLSGLFTFRRFLKRAFVA